MSNSLRSAYAESMEKGFIAAIIASESADFMTANQLLEEGYSREDPRLVLGCVAQTLNIASNVPCDELADDYDMLSLRGPREHGDGSSVSNEVNRSLMIMTGLLVVGLVRHEKASKHARKAGNPFLNVECSKGGEGATIGLKYKDMMTAEVKLMYNEQLANEGLRSFLDAVYRSAFDRPRFTSALSPHATDEKKVGTNTSGKQVMKGGVERMNIRASVAGSSSTSSAGEGAA